MPLRLLVCIGMVIYCIWQGFAATSIPASNGHNYFPFVYIVCVILLSSGLNKFGLITWPLTTILLWFNGHLLIGSIPLALVLFNVFGNKVVASER